MIRVTIRCANSRALATSSCPELGFDVEATLASTYEDIQRQVSRHGWTCTVLEDEGNAAQEQR